MRHGQGNSTKGFIKGKQKEEIVFNSRKLIWEIEETFRYLVIGLSLQQRLANMLSMPTFTGPAPIPSSIVLGHPNPITNWALFL